MISSGVDSSREADLTDWSSVPCVLAQALLASQYKMFGDGPVGPEQSQVPEID